MASTVGSSIGAMTIIAGTVSRKHPIKSSTRLMNIRTTYGLSDTLVKKVVIICGTFSKVMKVENTVEYPNKNEVTPFRTDVSRNSSKGGSGIGLSIVKKIMEDHGGKVWATSRLGIGTIMYFVLRKYQEVPVNE